MLDVHPPHAAAHTWKDFFIHIATICVGLLIAIGLEQTVEAIHQRHERAVLISEMRAEAAKNAEYLRRGLEFSLLDARWYHQAAQAIANAKPRDGKVSVTLPARARTRPFALASRSVWSIARASGKVALLPEDQAETYDRLDLEGALSMAAAQNLQDSGAKYEALLSQLSLPNPLQGTITIPVSQQSYLVSELELQSSLSHIQADCFYPWLGASEAVADGARNQEDIWPYFLRDLKLLQQ